MECPTYGQQQFTPPPFDQFTLPARDSSCPSRERSTWLAKLTESVPALELTRVIGLLPDGPQSVAYGPRNLVAYTASRFVVLYDPFADVQRRFLSSLDRSHAIGCVAFNRQGDVLAGGEKGQAPAPAVLVWRVKDGEREASRELRGHKYGVAAVAFSHDGELLASVGSGYDGQVIIWNWDQGLPLVKQRAQVDLTGVAFTPDSKKIVTTGKEHFKSWVLQSEPPGRRIHSTRGALALLPKPAMNGIMKNMIYADVKSTVGKGIGGVCAVTRSGTLSLMWGTSRAVDKQINLNVAMAFGLAVSDTRVACACSSGVVKLYTLKNLAFLAQLPYPDMPDSGLEQSALYSAGEKSYPDALACAFHQSGDVLCTIYSDRTTIFWDVKDKSQIRRLRTIETHSGPIYDIVPHPCFNHSKLGSDIGETLRFASCSSDGTARIWSCETNLRRGNVADADRSESLEDDPSASWVTGGTRWASTSRIIRMDGGNSLKSTSNSNFFRETEAQGQGATVGEGGACLRALKISPDGDYLAVGDDDGLLRVFELHKGELVMKKAVHNGVLNRLSFSNPQADDEKLLLATGGTDGQVSLFDMDDFDGDHVVKFRDHHQKDISGVSFAEGGRKIVSCGRDKYMTFRSLQHDSKFENEEPWFQNQYLPQALQYDMSVNHTRRVAMAACSDRMVRMWCMDTGTIIHTFETSKKAEDPIRIIEGPIPTTVVCCHSNATACIYEYFTGQLLANATGHSELLTGAAVVGGGSYLATSGTDGCIFIWKIKKEILHTALMTARKDGVATETGLMAPICEEMRSKLPRGADAPVTPSRRKTHPAVVRMRFEAHLATRANRCHPSEPSRPPARVPRLNLTGIGAGPPDIVRIDAAEIFDPVSSSVSTSSPSKTSLEQKDSDGSKETWTGGGSSTVQSSHTGFSKKLLRKDQPQPSSHKMPYGSNSSTPQLRPANPSLKMPEIPSDIEQLAYPDGNHGGDSKHMDDFINDYNRERVLQWVKDYAQHAVTPHSSQPKKQSFLPRATPHAAAVSGSKLPPTLASDFRAQYHTASDLDRYRVASAAAVAGSTAPASEKKQRTTWCIPDLPQSPEAEYQAWFVKSELPESFSAMSVQYDAAQSDLEPQASAQELQECVRAPWSESDSDNGTKIQHGSEEFVDSNGSETSFRGALVRAQLSHNTSQSKFVYARPNTTLYKRDPRAAPIKLNSVLGNTNTVNEDQSRSSEASDVSLNASSCAPVRIARQSNIPKRSNRQSGGPSKLGLSGGHLKGAITSFGYQKLHRAKVLAPSVKQPVMGAKLPSKLSLKKKKGEAQLSALPKRKAEAPSGSIQSASTKAYCNPIYDHSNLEDESGTKSIRSVSGTGLQKGIVKIDAEITSEPILSGIEKDQMPQTIKAQPIENPIPEQPETCDSTGTQEFVESHDVEAVSRGQHAVRESMGSFGDPPKGWFGKLPSSMGDDPPEPLALGSSPRDRRKEHCPIEDRPLSAPPSCIEQMYSGLEYLPAVKWTTTSKEDSSKRNFAEYVSSRSIASSLPESERLEPPHSSDTAARGGSPRAQEMPRKLFPKERTGSRHFSDISKITTGSTIHQDMYAPMEPSGVPITTDRVFLSKGMGSVAGGEDLARAWETMMQSASDFGRTWKKTMGGNDNARTSMQAALLEELSKNLFGENNLNSVVKKKQDVDVYDESTQTTGTGLSSSFADDTFKRLQCKIDQALMHMRSELDTHIRQCI